MFYKLTVLTAERAYRSLHTYSTADLSPNSAPTLSFRTPVFTENAMVANEQSRPQFHQEINRVRYGDPTVQNLGLFTLREDRVVMEPDTFKRDPCRSA